MEDFPAVDLLQDVLLVGQIRDGGPSLVFEFHVRVARKVLVPRLPRLAVGAHERHPRSFHHCGHLLGFT